jgi:hypothetical protein
MAQADPVPTATRRHITGAPSKTSTKHARWCWHEIITGGMPIGPYIVTAFYATAVILVGCAPWNFLLILGLLLNRDEVSSRWGSSS